MTWIYLVSGLMSGLGLGFEICFLFLYIPLDKQYQKFRQMTLEHLEKQIETLKGISEKLPLIPQGGSVVSPIQLKREE